MSKRGVLVVGNVSERGVLVAGNVSTRGNGGYVQAALQGASHPTRCKPYHKMQAIPHGASHPTWCKPSHMVQAIPQGTVCLVSTFRTYKPIARAPKHNRFTIWGNSAATAAARTAWTITISLFCMRISSRISIISLAPAGMLIILPSADV